MRFKRDDGSSFPNWEAKKLGEIVKTYSGGTPQSGNAKFYNGDIPFIKSGEIDQEITEQKISTEGLKSSSAKLVGRGDLLYALYGATSGETAISKISGAINQAVLCIRSEQDIRFLYQFLLYSKGRILSKYLQGGQGNLSAEIVKSIPLYLPNKIEQQKIALFLSAVDEKISALQRRLELLQTYKRGVMQKLFSQEIRFKREDGSSFPDWQEKTVGDIASIVGGGTPDTSKPEFWNGNIPWFTPSEIKKKYLAESLRMISQEGLKNSSAKLLPKGTLLLSTRATVGEVGISLEESTTNQGFQSLIVKAIHSNEFWYYWILNNKKQFLRRAAGSTFLEISKSSMLGIKVASPSFLEQQKIASFLTAIDTKLDAVNQQISLTEQFKKGLLQQMFV